MYVFSSSDTEFEAMKLLLEMVARDYPEEESDNASQPKLRPTGKSSKSIRSIMAMSNKVFIVHGHDDGAKLELASLLQKMGM